MDPFKSNQAISSKKPNSSQQNSFARALAELEKNSSSQAPKDNKEFTNNSNDIFNADQKQRSGQLPIGQNSEENRSPENTNMFQEMMRDEAEKKRKNLERHREVNPVNLHEVYNRRAEQNTEKINQVRKELAKLMADMSALNKEVGLAVSQDVVSVGLSGAYHENFFEKLRQVIIMLRQKVGSARTWARQQRMKQARKNKKYGLDFSGNEAKSVHDSFHHERSMSFGA